MLRTGPAACTVRSGALERVGVPERHRVRRLEVAPGQPALLDDDLRASSARSEPREEAVAVCGLRRQGSFDLGGTALDGDVGLLQVQACVGGEGAVPTGRERTTRRASRLRAASSDTLPPGQPPGARRSE